MAKCPQTDGLPLDQIVVFIRLDTVYVCQNNIGLIDALVKFTPNVGNRFFRYIKIVFIPK
ncbi:hypothetical protein D3C71_839540 [compost metagenome]